MTIALSTGRNDYPGAGSVGPYPFTFKVFAATDLQVIKRSTTGTETILAYPAAFSVLGVGNAAGGSVTLVTALAVGEQLTIRRAVPLTQATDLRNAGTFFPEVHEDQFDRLVAIDQQQQDQLDRSLRISPSFSPTTYDLMLRELTAGKVVTGTGTGLTMAALDSSAVAIPGAGRTVTTLSGYLANNAVFNIKDYGAVCDSVADDTAAIQLAIDKARLVGGVVEIVGRPRTTARLDCTFRSGDTATARRAIRVVFKGNVGFGPSADLSSAMLIADHNDVVIDCTGSYNWIWENANITTAAGKSPVCGWLLARNSATSSAGQHAFMNCTAWGSFVNGVVYSYASEENFFWAPKFVNTYPGGEVFCITANNSRSVTSTSIATGVQSNICFNVYGGSLNARNTGGRVFTLDVADFVHVDGAWMLAGDGQSIVGDSLVYVDMTRGPSNYGRFLNITGESGGAFMQRYGFYFSNTAGTPTGWTIKFCRLPALTAPAGNLIFASALVILDSFHIEQINNPAGGPSNMTCTNLQNSYFNCMGATLTISGTSTKNKLLGDQSGWTIAASVKEIGLDSNTGTVRAANGVKFQSAVSDPSTDPNTFDDWREVTPAACALAFAGGGTVTVNAGATKTIYNKGARQVTAWINIQLSSVAGGPTGNVTITGLPFSNVNDAAQITPGKVVADGIAAAIVAPLQVTLAANSTVLTLWKCAAGGITRLQGADLTATTSLWVEITYNII